MAELVRFGLSVALEYSDDFRRKLAAGMTAYSLPLFCRLVDNTDDLCQGFS